MAATSTPCDVSTCPGEPWVVALAGQLLRSLAPAAGDTGWSLPSPVDGLIAAGDLDGTGRGPCIWERGTQ